MIEEPPKKTWIVVIVTIISAAGVICAAIIGLGAPFAERIADRYYPPLTPATNSDSIPPTNVVSQNQESAIIPTSIDPPTSSASISTESSTASLDGPFREHIASSIGTGVFTQVTFSDGNAPYSSSELNTSHFRIYAMRIEDNPDGCGISIYNTDKIWITGSVNTIFTINGQEVGKLSVSTGKHGYVANWGIQAGDKVCAKGYSPSGFSIIFGPDMYYHYDSYCYRGFC